MSSSENDQVSSDKEKDHVWVWAKKADGEKYIRCGFCDQVCSGGITRLKKHLAGTHGGMKPCRKVSKEAKDYCLDALNSFKALTMKQNTLLHEIGEGCGGSNDSVSQDDSSLDESGYVLAGIGKGPMNKFVVKKTQQGTLNSAFKKEERKRVCRKIGRFFFNNGIAFNAADSPYFLSMVDAIAEFGKELKPPSMYELRTWILKEEVNDMNLLLAEHKQYWKNYGCSIMSDGWPDGKGRVLINFLIDCPAGCFFLKSIDASELVKDGDTLCKCLDEIVEEVGEDNVVQIITDNASNYKNIESWAAPSISRNLPLVPSRPSPTIHPQPTHSSPPVPPRTSPTIHDQATPSSPPFVASGTGYAACKRKGSASTSNNGAKRSCPTVIVNDDNEDVDMEPHFDSANFPAHFDAWDEFHTEVEVDPNALSDEEGRQWNE